MEDGLLREPCSQPYGPHGRTNWAEMRRLLASGEDQAIDILLLPKF